MQDETYSVNPRDILQGTHVWENQDIITPRHQRMDLFILWWNNFNFLIHERVISVSERGSVGWSGGYVISIMSE